MLLGFEVEGVTLGTLCDTVLNQEGRALRGRYAQVVQAEYRSRQSAARAEKYLARVLGVPPSVYWGGAREFLREVRRRVAAAGPGGGDS
jgi:hypothetical protein